MRSEYEFARIELEELIDRLGVNWYPGSDRLVDAARLAIEALRKQEPMKLEIDGEFDLLCAGCGSVLDFKGHDGDYCPNCGQKIDWTEVET